jgi:protein ImuB
VNRTIAVVFPAWSEHHDNEVHAYTAFEGLVRRVGEVSPLIEVDSVGVMVMSARGPSRYFGGERAVAEHLVGLCRHENIPFGVGIADGRFAAMGAAHLSVSQGQPGILASSVTQQFIDALHVQSVAHIGGVSPDVVGLLRRLGLSTCGAVREVGEAALIDRFGAEGRTVWTLVSGGEVRVLSPGVPPSDFAQSREFEPPLGLATHVVAAMRDTVALVVDGLTAHGMQCVRLLVECETDHAETSARVWGEPRGFDTAAVLQRITYQLDGWLVADDADPDAPTSGIVRVRLVPLECRETLVVQPVLWGGHEENIERAARAATMALAVHRDVSVTVPRWEGGRDITQVYSHVPLSMVNLSNTDASQQRVTDGRGIARDWSGAVPRPSPACVFHEPREVRVVDSHDNPVSVSGRHELTQSPAFVEIEGHRYRVERVAGPWPVEERWWDTRRRRRHVRVQMLVRTRRGARKVFLLSLEHSVWRLLARYD